MATAKTETSAPRRLIPDAAEIARSLQRHCLPGEVIEIRALEVGPRKITIAGYFDHQHLAEAARLVFELPPGGTVNIPLNRIDPGCLARSGNHFSIGLKALTNDKEIIRRKWLLIDLDPCRVSGVSATDTEKAAALARAELCREFLTDQGWGAPLVADSGNGAHLLFPIDLPNDAAATALLQRVLQALGVLFTDDLVKVDLGLFKAAQLVKLYGTLAAGKGDHTSERPHRLSRVLDDPGWHDGEIVTRAQLEAVAERYPQPEPPGRRGAANNGGGHGAFEIEAWLGEHGVPVAAPSSYQDGLRWRFARDAACPFGGGAHDAGAAFIVKLASGAIAAGCHHASCFGKGWHDLRQIYEPGFIPGLNGARPGALRGRANSAAPPGADQVVEEDPPPVIGAVAAQLQYTDTWLAGRFMLAHPDEFIFRQELREWQRWNGESWQGGMQGGVNQRITAINLKYSNALKVQAETQDSNGEPPARELREMANRIASQNTLRSVELLLRSMLADQPLDVAKRPGIMASEIEETPVNWLWPGYILAGRPLWLEGDPDIGKSYLTVDLAARISTGREWPDGTPGGPPRNVILLSSETDQGTRDRPGGQDVKRRLRAAGADMTRVRVMSANVREGHHKHVITFPDDLPMLTATAKADGAALIVIDPLIAFAASRLRIMTDQQDARRLMLEMEDLSAESGAATILIRHLNKDSTEHNPLYRGGGSIGLTAALRAEFLAGYDPTDAEPTDLLRRRVFANSKFNDGPKPPALAFKLGTAGPDEPAWIEWIKGPCEVTAEQILAGPDLKGASVTKAIDLLAKALAATGWALSEDLELAAREEQITRTTMSRARKLLGVKHGRVGPAGRQPGSFLVNWLPRQCGEDFDPNQCPELTALLERRRAAPGAGREDWGHD